MRILESRGEKSRINQLTPRISLLSSIQPIINQLQSQQTNEAAKTKETNKNHSMNPSEQLVK